jgi:protein O-GlcNAc transferase
MMSANNPHSGDMTIQQALELALQHHQSGRLHEAERIYRQILAREPNHADALHFLGVIAHQMGQYQQAVELIGRAIVLNPSEAIYYNNLGLVLQHLGRSDVAINAYRTAIQFKRDYAQPYYNMGNTLMALEQWDSAMASFQSALQLNPDNAVVWNNLGNVLQIQGRLDEAIKAYREVIRLKPDFSWAYNNLGMALKEQGQVDEAIAVFRAALQINPASNQVHGNLIFILHFHPDYEVRVIYEEHVRWNLRHATPLKQFIRPHANNCNPERPLRIGYVSRDFRNHSVACFMENLLTAHDSEQVDVFCYADLPHPDDTSAILRSRVRHWRNITGINDQETAEMVRRDQIDILVDLAGHTADNRLLLFARKPAPIQVTYLGYPDTTGLNAMDYRFTDAFADPPGTGEEFYTEQLVRLPETFLCFCPPHTAPPCTPPPVAATGYITFGSFNALPKINIRVVRLWSQILQRLPASRMLIKNNGLLDAGAQRHLRKLFAGCGIGPERLNLCGWVSSITGHLQLYQQMDLALDTFPYHGTTTTCEALWMGVPVVTLAGNMHMSRVGVSLLMNVGLPELIAETPEQYVEIAIKLAGDLPRLAELRSMLRQRMQASPLMDAPRFSRNIEAAYRTMWHKWCSASPRQ